MKLTRTGIFPAFPAVIWLFAFIIIFGGLPGKVQAQRTNFNFQASQAAADKGDAKAEYDLARAYEKGLGVARDPARAVTYMRQSADQGYAAAEGELGYFYGTGFGVKKDATQALQWFQKSADQGNAVAQFAMGNIYYYGLGVTPDNDKAVKWWKIAAAQNLPEAENAMGLAYLRLAPTNLSFYVQAVECFQKAVDQGYVKAMNNLGNMYDYGHGVPKNWPAAAKWYRLAAEHGIPEAQANLGLLYLDGRGVTNDVVQAYAWFRLSEENGNGMGRKYLYEFTLNNTLSTNQIASGEKLLADYRLRYGSAKP
jgi:TPR repeat protein